MDEAKKQIILRTGAYERFMMQHGTELIQEYNSVVGQKITKVQIYVDPQEGKLRADIVMDSGAIIPLLVDVSPDWEDE